MNAKAKMPMARRSAAPYASNSRPAARAARRPASYWYGEIPPGSQAVTEPHSIAEQRTITDGRIVHEWDADLERVRHAGPIGIPKKPVAHVARGLQV